MKFGQRGLDAYKAQKDPPAEKEPENKAALPALKALLREQKAPLSPPETQPGLLKTGEPPAKSPESTGSPQGLGKAARFLLLLGKDEAGNVLRSMKEGEIERLTAEIARTGSVSLEEARLILDDFGYNLRPRAVEGGIAMAQEILNRAFGEEKGLQLISKAVPEAVPAPFAFMNDLTLPQVLQVLREESIESLSIILSFLKKETASAYIKTRDQDDQVRLIKRMARLGKLHPDVISRMETLLSDKVHTMATVDEVEIDGPAKLTEILRHMNLPEEARILRHLQEKDPVLGRRVREGLLTMECIFQLRPRDLQDLLMETPNETLVLLLKDKEDRVVEHLLSHLSSQRRMILEEERIIAPLVPRKEVREVTKEFLETIRRKQEEGSYILLSEEDEYLV